MRLQDRSWPSTSSRRSRGTSAASTSSGNANNMSNPSKMARTPGHGSSRRKAFTTPTAISTSVGTPRGKSTEQAHTASASRRCAAGTSGSAARYFVHSAVCSAARLEGSSAAHSRLTLVYRPLAANSCTVACLDDSSSGSSVHAACRGAQVMACGAAGRVKRQQRNKRRRVNSASADTVCRYAPGLAQASSPTPPTQLGAPAPTGRAVSHNETDTEPTTADANHSQNNDFTANKSQCNPRHTNVRLHTAAQSRLRRAPLWPYSIGTRGKKIQ